MAKEKADKAVEELTTEERLLRIQERQLELQERALGVQQAQIKQTAPKSNTQAPKISAFNPRGEKDFPLPPLKCDIFLPFKLSPLLHSLDREEIELLNRLTPSDDYVIDLSNGDQQHICVVGSRNHATGKLESMAFKGPRDDQGQYAGLFTNENRQTFPSLKLMLRQMLGEAAADVQTMRSEFAAIADGTLLVSQGA